MDNLIQFPKLADVLYEFAVEVRNLYQDNLILNNRIASGNLLNNIDFRLKINDSAYSVIFSMEDYWWYVENGRKAGKRPPMDKILEWIKIKPILPKPSSEKLPTPNQLAFLIARKIGEEGTEGTGDLSYSIEKVFERYREKIYTAIYDDVDNAVIKIFKYD